MVEAGFIQIVANARQHVDDGLVLGNLAVKNTQRLRERPALAVHADIAAGGFQGFAQSFIVSRAVVGTSNRGELQAPVSYAEAIEKRRQQLQKLGVACGGFAAGGGRPDHFCANLIKLSIASLLGTLPAILRADVVELVLATIPMFVLDVGAHNAGGIFGTKGVRLPIVAGSTVAIC